MGGLELDLDKILLALDRGTSPAYLAAKYEVDQEVIESIKISRRLPQEGDRPMVNMKSVTTEKFKVDGFIKSIKRKALREGDWE